MVLLPLLWYEVYDMLWVRFMFFNVVFAGLVELFLFVFPTNAVESIKLIVLAMTVVTHATCKLHLNLFEASTQKCPYEKFVSGLICPGEIFVLRL
jgi:hypothetical protein